MHSNIQSPVEAQALGFPEAQERAALEKKMLGVLTPAELARWRWLNGQGNGETPLAGRHPSKLADLAAVVAADGDAPAAVDMKSVVLVVNRPCDVPLGGVEIDGVPALLGLPLSWMSRADFDAFAAAYHEQRLMPVWERERAAARTFGDTRSAKPHAAFLRKHVYWAEPLEGPHRFDLRKIAHAAGRQFAFGDPYRVGEIVAFARGFNDPLMMFRCGRDEHLRALGAAALLGPQGPGKPDLHAATWVQSGGGLGFAGEWREVITDPLAVALLQAAKHMVNDAAGVTRDLEAWWRKHDPRWAARALPQPPKPVTAPPAAASEGGAP